GLKPAREKPSREELLSYYVRFVLENELKIQTEEMVTSVVKSSVPYDAGVATVSSNGAEGASDGVVGAHYFTVKTNKRNYEAKNVLFAIGAMDYPRGLGVKGEDLPKVHDHFRETYPWVKKHALIVG